jgi:hypothetical protein
MALTFTSLTHGSDPTDSTTYNTASVTPGASRLILVLDSGRRSSGVGAQPTITGCGLTWVQVGTIAFGTTRRASISRAMGTPSSGAITITYAATLEFAHWQVIEVDGMDTSGTNGSGAIVGSAVTGTDTNTSLSLTLPAFGSANNAALGFFVHAANESTAPGSGFSEIVDFNNAYDASTGFQSEYKLNSTTVDASWATSQAAWGIALEIKAAAGGGGALPFRYYQRMQQFQRQRFERRRSGIYVPATTFAKAA